MSSAAPSSGLSNMVSKLDKAIPTQLGENGLTEYGKANNDLRERFVQLTFQSVRGEISTRYQISQDFAQWINDVLTIIISGESLEVVNNGLDLLETGFRSILHLRDVVNGKGECRLAYSMLIGWHSGCNMFLEKTSLTKEVVAMVSEFRISSTRLLARLFMVANTDNKLDHQYGSFKDFKYFCQELILHKMCVESSPSLVKNDYEVQICLSSGKQRKGTKNFRFSPEHCQWLKEHSTVSYLAKVIGEQIYQDFCELQSDNAYKNISLAARWAPRHGSDLFGPLACLLEESVVPESKKWFLSAGISKKKDVRTLVRRKVDTIYRKRLSALNRYLETIQVKQCGGQWKDIDFDKHLTSITLSKQKTAFQKETDEDRKHCAENFRAFQERVNAGMSTAKGYHVQIKDFVKEALRQGCNSNEQLNIELLDAQWKNKGENIKSLGDFIAMVDTSGSMTCNNCYPLYTAIGLGIRIAEKSRLGRRVMTFSQKPSWVSLESESFVENVHKVQRADWGMNTNFEAALMMILKAAEEANMTADDVNSLTLVILSDMQMDNAGKFNDELYSHIKQSFSETGIRVSGESWNVPRIVFWNLNRTNWFPSKSDDERSIMISGGSDSLLNALCENGLASLEQLNPWIQLHNMLDTPRYNNSEFKVMMRCLSNLS